MTNTVVMVVDDDPDFLALIDDLLSHEGYQVVGCEKSSEALEKAKQSHPAVIIVDLIMPGLSGLQLIEVLLGDPETSATPIIVSSATQVLRPPLSHSLVQLGVSVLAKPFSIDDLMQMVGQAANLNQGCA